MRGRREMSQSRSFEVMMIIYPIELKHTSYEQTMSNFITEKSKDTHLHDIPTSESETDKDTHPSKMPNFSFKKTTKDLFNEMTLK